VAVSETPVSNHTTSGLQGDRVAMSARPKRLNDDNEACSNHAQRVV